VFIQFGHNDEKIHDPLRYTRPDKEYKDNLSMFITTSREHGAHPVIMSSICRRDFDEQGNLVNTHGTYPQAARETAEELQAPFIDMELKTRKLIVDHGIEGSNNLFVRVAPGVFDFMPEGKIDNTHLSIYGATQIAGLVAEGIKELGLPISGNITTK
jgi:lysophospholipase L1-like esterase